jgi:hypothetical protein
MAFTVTFDGGGLDLPAVEVPNAASTMPTDRGREGHHAVVVDAGPCLLPRRVLARCGVDGDPATQSRPRVEPIHAHQRMNPAASRVRECQALGLRQRSARPARRCRGRQMPRWTTRPEPESHGDAPQAEPGTWPRGSPSPARKARADECPIARGGALRTPRRSLCRIDPGYRGQDAKTGADATASSEGRHSPLPWSRRLSRRRRRVCMMCDIRRTTIYLPDELKSALQRTATARGTREAEVVRHA